MKQSYKKILFVVNYEKPNAKELSLKLAKIATSAGLETEITTAYPVAENSFENADLCCIIGGDGTILAALKGAVKHNVPIFGVNLGKLGFMATLTDETSNEDFLKILNGENEIEKRNLLQAEFSDKKILALNDFAVKSPSVAKAITLDVFVNNEFVSSFLGDGLIFSTPTGSTAYNLSAGGPIIHPTANAFVMTSICPHTLSSRSIVFDSSAEIEIKTNDAALIADGNQVQESKKISSLKISLAKESLNFLRPLKYSHFSILRTKLGWLGNTNARKRSQF